MQNGWKPFQESKNQMALVSFRISLVSKLVSHGFREQNLGPLQEQYVLLTPGALSSAPILSARMLGTQPRILSILGKYSTS